MTLRWGDYPPISKWAQGNHIILKIGETLLTVVRDRCDGEKWSERGNIAGLKMETRAMIKNT